MFKFEKKEKQEKNALGSIDYHYYLIFHKYTKEYVCQR